MHGPYLTWVMPVIDINVSYGSWPFQRFDHSSLKALAEHQSALGISCSLVSHLGAVWHPDPDPFNRALIEEASLLDCVRPLAVINPLWPAWEEQLDLYLQQGVVGVKLYPSYHNYRITQDVAKPLLAYLMQKNVSLFVQIRMEDERMQHPAAQIDPLGIKDVIELHQSYPSIKLICLNAYLSEVRAVSKEAPDISFDTSFCEWLFTMEHLLEAVGADQIFLGTHTPFLYTYAGIAKVKQSRISDGLKRQITLLNGRHLLDSSCIS